MVFFSLVKN